MNQQISNLLDLNESFYDNLNSKIITNDKKSIEKSFNELNLLILLWATRNISRFYKWKNKNINEPLIRKIEGDVVKKLNRANNDVKNKILKNLNLFRDIDRTLPTRERNKLIIDIIKKNKLNTYTTQTGRRINIEYYTKIVVQSAMVQARNSAVLFKCKQLNIDLVRVTYTSNPCPICKPIEGKIFSISGNHPQYPKLPFHKTYLSLHINCLHYLLPYR